MVGMVGNSAAYKPMYLIDKMHGKRYIIPRSNNVECILWLKNTTCLEMYAEGLPEVIQSYIIQMVTMHIIHT